MARKFFPILVTLFFVAHSMNSFAMSKCVSLLSPEREAELDHYLKTGDIFPSWLVNEALLYDHRLKDGRPGETYTEKEERVLQAIVRDLNTADLMLSEVVGKPKKDCPYEKDVAGTNGYKFIRTDYIGRHLISITRERDHFYWNIGVRYEGDFWGLGNDVKIQGYYHAGTNGSLVSLREALEATKDFFPSVEK